MKLSIVVPVYKVEKFIIKCIDSLLNQNFDDYEIIIVDDGTPDRSIEILKEKYNPLPTRVTIISQVNQGLSEARNNGFKVAKGEYVWFFDSDDWCEVNVLGEIANCLDGSDVIYFNKYNIYKDGVKTFVSFNNTTRSGKELSSIRHIGPAQFYIYKSSFLRDNNLSFKKGILHEDNLYVPIVLYTAETVRPCNVTAYNFYKRSGSITQTLTPKHCTDLRFIVGSLYNFYINNVADAYKKEWSNNVTGTLLHLLDDTVRCDKEIQKMIKEWLNDNIEINRLLKLSRKRDTRLLGYVSEYLPISLFTLYKTLHKLKY